MQGDTLGDHARYAINGLVATPFTMQFTLQCIEVGRGIKSAGLANLLRPLSWNHNIFSRQSLLVCSNTERFPSGRRRHASAACTTLAVLHGLTLLVWTDWFGTSFTGGFGFSGTTGFQVSLSYLGNHLVSRVQNEADFCARCNGILGLR